MFELLKTKPHNAHYLNKYINFIKACKIANESLVNEYTEKHHIAPKAKDLFPEEANNSKNLIYLTARQHIIAHIMLWKAYGGSQIYAIDYILNKFNHLSNPKNLIGRKIPTSLEIRYAAKAREAARKFHSGKATYKDKEGNKYYLETNDPLIQELNLAGNNMGYSMSEESKENMRGKRVVKLFYKGSIQTKTFKIDDPEVERHIRLGWSIEKDEQWLAEERQKAKQRQIDAARIANQGTPMYYPSGIYYGRLPKDSPIIKELNLRHIRSEKQISQNAGRVELATKARLGTKIWTNGTEEKFSIECPGEEWIIGRTPRTGSFKENHAKATSEAIAGSTTWNDGIKNYRLKKGEKPESHWVKGMKKQNKRKNSGKQLGMIVYNDGIRNYKIQKDAIPESHWVKGMIRKS